MFSLGMFNLSKVLAITNKANVESNPPEIPITAFFIVVWSSLLARAEVCILNISLHLTTLSSLLEGTKGYLSIGLSKSPTSLIANLKVISSNSKFIFIELSLKLTFLSLSLLILSISIILVMTSFSRWNLLFSFNIEPFSPINKCPLNTKSVEDSYTPDEEYT